MKGLRSELAQQTIRFISYFLQGTYLLLEMLGHRGFIGMCKSLLLNVTDICLCKHDAIASSFPSFLAEIMQLQQLIFNRMNVIPSQPQRTRKCSRNISYLRITYIAEVNYQVNIYSTYYTLKSVQKDCATCLK